jgi:tetraacyldisaccharide 4'-kinase
MDATAPTDSGWVLPAGALREPLHAASRASALVLSHCDIAPDTEPIETLFHRYNPGAPVFHTAARLLEVVLQDGRRVDPSALAGEPVAAFCGIGNPALFRQDLRRAGMQVAVFAPFSDHHWYTDDDLKALSRRAKDNGATHWITTEKDFVRLSDRQRRSYPIGRLGIAVEIREEPQFRSFLMNALQAGSAA